MKRILIADDNSPSLYFLDVLLKAHGFDVITATNGAEALESARALPPDMILTDILMPVMDGYTLCRECKSNERLKKIPFIFYTATYTDQRDEKFGLSLGADRFVIKPQEPLVLVQIIRDVFAEVHTEARDTHEDYYHEENRIFSEYSEVLFHKLEKKIADLEQTNLELNRNLTERNRAEKEKSALQEKLRQSQKLETIGLLAGGVAHDFNNLLTIILGNAQLALLDPRVKDTLKARLVEIMMASERAADLTRQLLAFGRKQILEMQILDLSHVFQKIDKMLRRIIGEDIQLVVIPSLPVGKVKADPWQIEQVLMNLAVNARDAMPDGGRLTIEAANVELDDEYARKHISVQPGKYVMLSVSDTGEGMTPEDMERVFDPFFTTKARSRGTGLGLSAVYGIVKQSGGNIWVYSEPGIGTTFKIYLPQVDETLDKAGETSIEEIPGGHETVLVVEDDDTVRQLAVMILERYGYKVLEALDGNAALFLCEEFKDPIHMILTDVVMPGMSGRKLIDHIDHIKKIHPEIKVLYMSGYTDNAIVHHGILDAGTNFIQKPFTVDGLARKVRKVFESCS